MKRLFIIFCIVFSVNPIYSQLPNYLQSFDIGNDSILFMVGSNGIILKTTDQGTTWINLDSPTTQFLNSVDFINLNTGWIPTGNDIIKTTDAGNTWNYLNIANFFNGILQMQDENTGWMRGLNARLQKTTDGGNTWNTNIVSTIGNFNITSIFFIDSLNGWITGFWNSAPQIITGLVYKTSNGGQSWDWQYWANQTALSSVYFVSKDSGWAVGKYGFVIKSTNGGIDWIEANSQITQNLNSVFFSSPQTGWISGEDSLLITSDGGNNWDKVGFGQSVISTKFYDNQLGFAITGYDFLKTIDGGYTWSSNIILSSEDNYFTTKEFFLFQNYPNPFLIQVQQLVTNYQKLVL
jgi:photosystem II stability/assembly factor-like uncharacterized protein